MQLRSGEEVHGCGLYRIRVTRCLGTPLKFYTTAPALPVISDHRAHASLPSRKGRGAKGFESPPTETPSPASESCSTPTRVPPRVVVASQVTQRGLDGHSKVLQLWEELCVFPRAEAPPAYDPWGRGGGTAPDETMV